MGMKARDGVLGIPVSLYGYFSLWNSAGLERQVNLHPFKTKTFLEGGRESKEYPSKGAGIWKCFSPSRALH